MSGKSKYTTEIFIQEANLTHSNKYSAGYNKVVYTTTISKVQIECPEHGDFWQTPAVHLNGHGCPKCGNPRKSCKNPKRLTTEQYVLQAKEKFPDYDFSQVVYVNAYQKIKIVCPQHGDFQQTPRELLRDHGCPKCGRSRGGVVRALPMKTFLNRANEVHGSLYDYSKSVFVDNSTKIEILCKEHGSFWQTPKLHTQGKHKCPQCAPNAKVTHEEYISRVKEVHGDKYDHSNTIFLTMDTNVNILCPKHGEFTQRAGEHLKYGCISCSLADPKWQQEVREFVASVYQGKLLYNDRTTIKHPVTNRFRELDIYLPQIKIAFECQGSYFHDDTKFPGALQKDQEKQQLCLEAGITLICVWENEWSAVQTRELIENQIRDVIEFHQDGRKAGRMEG